MLAAAERTCEELHEAACRFDGHLAELDRWSTESLDCLQHLKEKKSNGGERSAKVSKSKVYPSYKLKFNFYI